MNLIFPLKSAFLALPLEGLAKWEFQRLVDELREFETLLTFQNPQSPHLTLQFWSELMEIEYHQIVNQCEKIRSKVYPFTVKIEGAGTFGHRGEDHVLYLSVPFSQELAHTKKLCPWPQPGHGHNDVPNKSFHPHITLARIKHPQRFNVVKKSVMKILDDVSFTMSPTMIRLYGIVEGVRQTPIHDFLFDQSSS